MRLGFVGCGRWASKIADQFRACGAEIVAYDRKTVRYAPAAFETMGYVEQVPIADPPGFGSYQPWRDQLEDTRIDAIVAMADPETTTAVALACAAAGKPVMATKPLMVTEMPKLTAPLYVDLWRLWGDRWKRARDVVAASEVVDILFTGTGPMRAFPGGLDYGPHAFAFAFDARSWGIGHPFTVKSGTGSNGGEWWTLEQRIGDRRVRINFGNGYSESIRRVTISRGRIEWDEPANINPAVKDAEIRSMCQSFLNDIHESNVSTYTLDISIRGMRLLQEAREKAVAK